MSDRAPKSHPLTAIFFRSSRLFEARWVCLKRRFIIRVGTDLLEGKQNRSAAAILWTDFQILQESADGCCSNSRYLFEDIEAGSLLRAIHRIQFLVFGLLVCRMQPVEYIDQFLFSVPVRTRITNAFHQFLMSSDFQRPLIVIYWLYLTERQLMVCCYFIRIYS